MIAAGLDPIKQFEIKKLAELKLGNFDISFTNSSLMMVICVACVALWLMLSTKKSLIPGRAQSVAEMSYEFVADMLRSATGKDHRHRNLGLNGLLHCYWLWRIEKRLWLFKAVLALRCTDCHQAVCLPS